VLTSSVVVMRNGGGLDYWGQRMFDEQGRREREKDVITNISLVTMAMRVRDKEAGLLAVALALETGDQAAGIVRAAFADPRRWPPGNGRSMEDGVGDDDNGVGHCDYRK